MGGPVPSAVPIAAAGAAANEPDQPAPTPERRQPEYAPTPAPLPILSTDSTTQPGQEDDGAGEQPEDPNGEQLHVVNTIVARVNDEIITREDVYRDMRGSMAQWRKTLSVEEFAARTRIVGRARLRSEINLRLLLGEARKKYDDERQKEALEKEVDKQWQRMLAHAGGSVADLRAELARMGYTEASWRKQQQQIMLVQTFLTEYMEPRITVTHQEMQSYYDSVKDQKYVVEPMEHVLMIKLRLQDHADEKAMMSLARSLVSRARSGEDFGKLARQFSRGPKAADGGDWGMMHRGSHRLEAVNEAQATLPVGGVSDPIVDNGSVTLVKVAQRQVGRTIPFTEVQDECRLAVARAKRDQMVAEYVKTLYSKNFVEVYDENL
jgi:parvulin-like peptidyl-prolyl isomerase